MSKMIKMRMIAKILRNQQNSTKIRKYVKWSKMTKTSLKFFMPQGLNVRKNYLAALIG